MSLQIKVSGGTPKSGKALCHSCKHANIIRGQNCEEIIFCNAVDFPNSIVPFRVAECRAHHPANLPLLHEMQEIAWKIEARRRGATGFQPPPGEEQMEIIITPPKKDNENGPTSASS